MKKVLVVDDSACVRQQVGEALSTAGYQIVEAEHGLEGLTMLETHPGIEMIICDLNMPQMNGLEMIERIKAGSKTAAPIVMLTTEAQPALIDRAKKAGAKGWIVKPFKSHLLVAAVQKLTAVR
jgi:two-component system, chemotaxis family, chemotaxis protein CheY